MIKEIFANRVRVGIAAMSVGLAMIAWGCASTAEAPAPEAAKPVESASSQPAAVAGFMGAYASKLQPGPAGGAALVWIYPDAKWINYRKMMLMPVEFWAGEDTKVSSADQRVLTGYFYNALKTSLEQNYTLADQPGPGTIKLRVALIDPSAPSPGQRSVSATGAQESAAKGAQSLGAGSYEFLGTAEAAMIVTDSESGDVFAEAVDKSAGAKAGSQWSDAQSALDGWAQVISKRLLTLQTGAAQ